MSDQKYLADTYNGKGLVNISKQVDLLSHDSQDFLNIVIEALCNLYNKEIVLKQNFNNSLIYSIDKYMANL